MVSGPYQTTCLTAGQRLFAGTVAANRPWKDVHSRNDHNQLISQGAFSSNRPATCGAAVSTKPCRQQQLKASDCTVHLAGLGKTFIATTIVLSWYEWIDRVYS